jgi:hypothetical protein
MQTRLQSLIESNMKTFTQHADESGMTEADRIAHAATWDAAIEAAASLFQQPYQEYFGSDIQFEIRTLATE